MKEEIIAELTKTILNTLTCQQFDDWYTGRFNDYIEGDLEEFGTESHLIAETLIKKDIQSLFNLV